MLAVVTSSVLPVLQVTLAAGESMMAETGQLAWMGGAVAMRTRLANPGAPGLLGAARRALGGGGLFVTEFTATGPGELGFAARLPGTILELPLSATGPAFLLHRHGFLCAHGAVTLDTALARSLGAGLFGGNGFRLQRLRGEGTAFVELGGEVVRRDLGPGETLLVHPGHLGMFSETVGFDVTTIRGVANAVFGGDGFFMARLTGPGPVWLQTLTLPGLAHALATAGFGGGEAMAATVKAGAGAAVTTEVVRGLFGRG